MGKNRSSSHQSNIHKRPSGKQNLKPRLTEDAENVLPAM